MVYISTSCVRGERISQVIETLAAAGIRNVELSGGTVFYDGLEADLIALKRRYHLTYSCHGYFPPPKTPFVINLASCNDSIYQRSLKHYEECIEVLKRIGCSVLSVHAGFLTEITAEEVGRRLSGRIVYEED